MFNSLKKILNQDKEDLKKDSEDLELLCGLMIEAAYTDGKVDQSEIDKIYKILTNIFKEDPEEAKAILEKHLSNLDDVKSLHFYTSKINKSFSSEKKILLIETLWEIILADGNIHEYESNLIRRLAGLLYISDVDCGNAKKKILSKLPHNDESNYM